MKKKKTFDLRGYSDGPIDDPDNPELTAEQIRRMQPMREFPDMLKGLLEASEKLRAQKQASRLPKQKKSKARATQRLNEEVHSSFKEDGPGWQGRINEELRKTVKRQRKK